MSQSSPTRLADPASLLGQLQRGRGSGALLALERHPADIAPLLLHCVTTDPRWDQQIEERSGYYADLILRTEADLQPFAECLSRHDDADGSLLLDTFGALAHRGSGYSLALLRDYVQWGAGWESALYDLGQLRSVSAVEGLDSVLCDRFRSDEELQDGLWMAKPEQEPWHTWMDTNPRLSRLIEQIEAERAARPDPRQAPPELADLSLPELFDRVTLRSRPGIARLIKERVGPEDLSYLLAQLQPEYPERAALALAGIAAIPEPRAVEPVRSLIERGGYPQRLHLSLCKAWKALPPEHTLPTAREWFTRIDPILRRFGEIVLREHALQEDLARFRNALPSALAEDESYRQCNVLDGMLRLDLPPSLPEVEQLFQEAAYSWTRTRAAQVLQRADPERFAQEWAVECLWDCDSRTRALACGAADLDGAGVRERLRDLQDAPWEDDTVRDEAGSRLEVTP